MNTRRRIPIWLTLIAGVISFPLAAVGALWAYKSATTPILHADPQHVRSVSSSEPSQKWAAAVGRAREIMRASLVQQNLPGLSVAVGVNGDIVWAEGFGYADLETQAAITPKTRFRVGDASKALTSAAVGLLLEENKLRLDDEIQVHVPEFPKKPWPITLRQLMAQVGGVTAHHGGDGPLSNAAIGDGNPAPRCERTVDGLQLDDFADRELLFEPGSRYRPSSYGWILVSAAVESAANTPFLAFMRTRVFAPVAMHDTTVDVWTDAIPDRATFYFPKFGLAADTRYGPKLARQGDHSCYAGAGAFLSTPSDLVRFGMASSLRPGRLPAEAASDASDKRRLATIQLLQTPQRLSTGKETGYGLGWDLETLSLAGEPMRMVGHGSKEDFIGAATNLMTFSEHGLAIAVMANISFADTRSVALNIAQTFAESIKGRQR